MSLATALIRLVMALLLVAGSGVAAVAQQGYPQPRQGYAPQGYPPQPAYRDPRAYPPGYYPGKLVQPGPQAPPQGFSLRRLFGVPDAPPPAPRPVVRPRRAAPPAASVARQEKRKANAATHLVVFGDAFANDAGRGLDELFADNENVAVVTKARDASLVRSDPADWPNFVKTTLDGGQKITLAVVMMGRNDRQPLKDGDDRVELPSERWKELYRQRVDAILQVFRERAIPVVWIGLPPMKNSAASADMVTLNEIYRESVERFGGAYVDIWPGFVDEENRYTATGPDVRGELAKLRASNGISFTRAGARKVAHFADKEIDHILETRQVRAPAIPAGDQEAASIEASIPAPPDAATPVVPVKPLVGPVLPLTRQDTAPGGTLVTGAPKLNGDQAHSVQRALRAGVAPSAQPGRADDFRWPNP
ncbi:SGNH/GDSL hydrolase family protein [Microvirga roseola]|uniref:SGNH/GDSL hydrolase family protein n=1 Tax=Microvirga roseola TaxID=2883126 RepID=UPI001E607ECF|nr:SGNH family hydrolase [Microvirga roseola]